MQIPDADIRKAIIAVITASAIGWPAYDTQVPKDANPNPSQYILLTTQTDAQHSTNKCGHLWSSTIILDFVSQQEQGFSSRLPLDNAINAVNDLIDINPGDISITGWTVYNTQVLNIHDMSLDTPTMTINRKLVRYQFIVGPSNG